MQPAESMGENGKLSPVFLFWNVAGYLGSSLIALYLIKSGFSIFEFLFFVLLMYLFPLIALFFFRGYRNREAMVLGIGAQALAYFLLALFSSHRSAVLFAAMGAFAFPLFWVPFNSMWLGKEKGRNATRSSIYYAFMMMVGLIAPAAAGFAAEGFGYSALFLASGLLFLPAMLFAWMIPEGGRVKLPLGNCIREFGGFRMLVFLEGFYGIALIVIPLITLQYFDEPVEFGAFFSAVTAVATVASILFAKASDRVRHRGKFIVLSSAGLGIATVAAAFLSSELVPWFAALLAVNFFRIVFYPFPLALVMDNRKSLPHAMYAREIYLNLGRVCAAAFAVAAYLFSGELALQLVVFGASALAYPLVFEKKKKGFRVH